MYELIQAGARTYYIECPARMGIYRTDDTHVLLIDSGNDKSTAKKVLQILERQGWTLSAILNTHSHADHIGGNRTLMDRTGCIAYAPGVEAAFTRSPVLEPSLLYGGCPPKLIWNKFLYAEPSHARELGTFALPDGLAVVPLPGHSPEQVGFRTPDDVYFLGDCVVGAPILEKYGVTYLYDVETALRTLDAVERLRGACFVAAHAQAVPDIAPLARLNRDKILENAQLIRSLCDGAGFEEILARVFERCGMSMNLTQYTLVGSTVRAYLSMLSDRGEVAAEVCGNRIVWRAAPQA